MLLTIADMLLQLQAIDALSVIPFSRALTLLLLYVYTTLSKTGMLTRYESMKHFSIES